MVLADVKKAEPRLGAVMIQAAGTGLCLPTLHCYSLQTSCCVSSKADFYKLIEGLFCPQEGRMQQFFTG